MQTIKQRRIKVADKYMAGGYGRGLNQRNVYQIDGYYYAYHPEYADGQYPALDEEFKGYVRVNKLYTYANNYKVFFFAACNDPSCPNDPHRSVAHDIKAD